MLFAAPAVWDGDCRPMGSPSTLAGSGGQILVQSLLGQGVDHVFCVPGESHLAVLDGLYDARDRIRLVVCRHESGASNMADAYGKLTGEPGVALVTRGPGATNASIGVHTASQDSTPLLLLVGQVPRAFADREAFQEIDYRRMFGQMAKWVAQIDDPRRVPEYVSHAFHAATSGRPGPVVLALPEDMLTEQAEANAAPRFQDLFDNDHPQYAGDVGIGINPKLARRVREADLALVLGPRLGEMTTSGYTLFEVPVPRQMLVHAHAGAEELGRVYAADLPIHSAMPELAAALAQLRRRPGRRRRRLRGPSTSPGTRRCACPVRCRWPRSWATCASGCRPTPSSRTEPATSPPGRTGSTAIAASSRRSRRPAARWVTAFRRPSRRRPSIPTGSWWRSRGTATSS